MTKEEKESFGTGFLLGVVAAIVFIAICGLISWWNDPVDTAHPNYALNSPEYTIDTIIVINGVDTTTTYKFRHIE